MDRKVAVLFLLISAVLSGISGAYVRTLSDSGFTLGQITFMFLSLTAIIMFVLIMFYDRKMLKVRREHLLLFVIVGIAKGVMDYTYVCSLNSNALSFATVLQMTAPFFVMIIAAIFFRRKITSNILLAMAVFVVGAVLVANVDPYRDISAGLGLGIGLTSGLMFAVVIVMSKVIIEKGYSPVAVVFYEFLIASLVVLPFTDFTDWGEHVTEGYNALKVVAFTVLCTLVPYTLDSIGIKYLKPMTASTIMALEIVFGAIVGATMFDEHISLLSIVGMALVILSTVMVIKFKEARIKELISETNIDGNRS